MARRLQQQPDGKRAIPNERCTKRAAHISGCVGLVACGSNDLILIDNHTVSSARSMKASSRSENRSLSSASPPPFFRSTSSTGEGAVEPASRMKPLVLLVAVILVVFSVSATEKKGNGFPGVFKVSNYRVLPPDVPIEDASTFPLLPDLPALPKLHDEKHAPPKHNEPGTLRLLFFHRSACDVFVCL